MLENRIHFALMATEDRLSSHRRRAATRAQRRVFRPGAPSLRRGGR